MVKVDINCCVHASCCQGSLHLSGLLSSITDGDILDRMISMHTAIIFPPCDGRPNEQHALKALCMLRIVLYREQQQDRHTKSHVIYETCNTHCVLVGCARASVLLTVGRQEMLHLAPLEYSLSYCMHLQMGLPFFKAIPSTVAVSSIRDFPCKGRSIL